MQKFAADQAESHVDQYDQRGEGQQQRCFREDLGDRGRNADDEQEQIDEISAEFLRTTEIGYLPFSEGGAEHGECGDPDILTAEEGTADGQDHAILRDQAADGPGDQTGQGDHGGGEGKVYRNVLQGDVLPLPVGSRLGLGTVGADGLHRVDVGVGEAAAEEVHAGKEDQREEIEGHEQIVCHGCRANQFTIDRELCGKGGEVDTAADVGAGHHGSDAVQAGNVVVQQGVGQHCADTGADRADQKDHHHPAGLFPDLPHIALQQEQWNAERDRKAPDHIVIERAVHRQNAEIGQHQRKDQGQDRAGDLGCPGVFLLQRDGEGHAETQDCQQHPGVIRGDQRFPPEQRKENRTEHDSLLML